MTRLRCVLALLTPLAVLCPERRSVADDPPPTHLVTEADCLGGCGASAGDLWGEVPIGPNIGALLRCRATFYGTKDVMVTPLPGRTISGMVCSNCCGLTGLGTHMACDFSEDVTKSDSGTVSGSESFSQAFKAEINNKLAGAIGIQTTPSFSAGASNTTTVSVTRHVGCSAASVPCNQTATLELKRVEFTATAVAKVRYASEYQLYCTTTDPAHCLPPPSGGFPWLPTGAGCDTASNPPAASGRIVIQGGRGLGSVTTCSTTWAALDPDCINIQTTRPVPPDGPPVLGPHIPDRPTGGGKPLDPPPPPTPPGHLGLPGHPDHSSP